MKEKVKEWIENEYKRAKNWGVNKYSIQCATHRSYGVLMFAADELLGGVEEEELGKWWDEEMLPKFRELEDNATTKDWKEK